MTDEHRDRWAPSPSRESARVVTWELDPPWETVQGASFDRLQVSYEAWGELSEGRDNAVLIVHPLASDPHASGGFLGQELGWWEELIGPGRALDTERWFVICPNLIGGCYGSTGPRFDAPDGEPYLERFPLLTPLDMMRAQRLFLQRLGIERLRMVLGPSMGGMVAWEWAVESGADVDRVVVIGAPLRTTAYDIGWNWLQRRGLELDLDRAEPSKPTGQMLARSIGMLSYRSWGGLQSKFGRGWFKQPGATLKDRGVFNVESWLRHHGRKFVKRFDAYTYLLFSRAMDLHDVGRDRGGLDEAIRSIECPVSVLGISSDQLYPARDVERAATLLERAGKSVRYREIQSPHGHDGFLLETEQISAYLAEGTD